MQSHFSVDRQAITSTHEARTAEPLHVTVVEAEACHFCEAAHATIDRVSQDVPLNVMYVSSRSLRGIELIQRHRAALAPLVLVEGRFISNGRLSEKLLRKRLGEASSARAGK